MLRALGQFPTAAELAELMQRMDANQVQGRGVCVFFCEGRAPCRLRGGASQSRDVRVPNSRVVGSAHQKLCGRVMPDLFTSLPCLRPRLQDGSICFDEFEAAMAGQAEDEETERQLREVRVRWLGWSRWRGWVRGRGRLILTCRAAAQQFSTRVCGPSLAAGGVQHVSLPCCCCCDLFANYVPSSAAGGVQPVWGSSGAAVSPHCSTLTFQL